MYKTITIGGEDYKLEYTIEASLYRDGIEKIVDYIVEMSSAENLEDAVRSFADTANTAITIFYAGLLEHHGPDGVDSDGRICTFKDAKRLISTYIKENDADFFDVIRICTDQMGADGFFKLIGVDKFFTPEKKKPVKIPQDHKAKAKPKSAKASEE